MKELKLTKLVDLVDVPDDDFDEFVVDLKAWLAGHKLLSAIGDELCMPPEMQISETMLWINDGKHNMNINIAVSDS